MYDIFVSYSRENKKEVQKIVNFLLEKKFRIWWDPEILPGTKFDEEIQNALASSKCIVVIWSSSSINSRWVKEEADYGQEQDILIPILIEDVKPPIGFGRIQAANLINWTSDKEDSNIETLVKSISKVVNNTKIDLPNNESSNIKNNIEDKQKKQWLIAAVIIPILLAILSPLLTFIITQLNQKEKFIIVNSILKPDSTLQIKADNNKSNQKKYLNIYFAGCSFPKKGIPVDPGTDGMQIWHFRLKDFLTKEMLKGTQDLQVGFPGGKRSEKFYIKFVENRQTTRDSFDKIKDNNFPPKVSIVSEKRTVQKQAIKNSKYKSGDTFKENLTGMEFVWIPGGCYTMGCGDWAHDYYFYCEEYEKPPHEVCIDGFWMGKTEVTQGEWKSIMNNNPASNSSGSDYPVENITWHEAKIYIDKLNKNNLEGSYRLPTEAEWEYACRSGGMSQNFSGGDKIKDFAWYNVNSKNKSHIVAHQEKSSNGLNLFDMSGNVQEWCEDSFKSNVYSNVKYREVNPVFIERDNKNKVVRGGSWCYSEKQSRCTARFGLPSIKRSIDIGFRVVKSEK